MRTLSYDEKTDELIIIDQTKLPEKSEIVRISTVRALYEAIYTLALRGAPAIGVGAALGLLAIAARIESKTPEGFRYDFEKNCKYINSSRPTAVNLSHACDRLVNASKIGNNIDEIIKSIRREAYAIEKEDIELCHAIGKHGEKLIKDGDTVLTHCNAGSLCAVEYGTALAPIYEAKANGKNVSVFADETRPLFQGARLTCFELISSGIDTTVICDNMAASLMSQGKIDLIIVGCDRVCANGDFANKIGTLSVAVNAHHFGVPFYVAVPSSTIDRTIKTGNDIIIEQRNGKEVTEMFFNRKIVPDGVKTYNPAFDVTPHELVTGYITENGVLKSI